MWRGWGAVGGRRAARVRTRRSLALHRLHTARPAPRRPPALQPPPLQTAHQTPLPPPPPPTQTVYVQDGARDSAARVRREVDLLRTLRDRNVVAFVGASLLPGATVLLTEYVAGGDLHAALAKDGRPGKGGKARVRRFTWAPDYVPAGRRPTPSSA